jgi:hypothetical protein
MIGQMKGQNLIFLVYKNHLSKQCKCSNGEE